MLFNIFKKDKLNIKEILKGYEKIESNDNLEETLNNVSNRIICTKEVFVKLPIKQEQDKMIFSFDDIIPIRNRNDFSYELMKKNWGAMMSDDYVECTIDDDGLISIWFETRYLAPTGIINKLLSTYRDEILWLYKPYDFNDKEKTRLCLYKNNKVITFMEKEMSKKEQDNSSFSIGFFIPYKAVYYGSYVNAFAQNGESQKYICKCQEKALYNKLKIFDEYMQYDYCLNDRKELLLNYLGLPEYYEEIIKKMDIPSNYLEYMKLFEFEDKICHLCNNVKLPDPAFYLNNGTSKFKQRYEGEKEKKYSISGIIEPNKIYQGNYFLECITPEDVLNIIKLDDNELIELLEEYNLSINIKEELDKLNLLSKEDVFKIKYSLNYDKKGHFKCIQYCNDNNINIDFIDAIQDIYDKRFKLLKKNINDEIHKIDKNCMDYKTLIDIDFGVNIYLKNNKKVLHINFYTDATIIEVVNEDKVKTYECNGDLNIFTKALEILSSDRINYNSENKGCEEWLICNGKKSQITERDGVRGYGCPIAINHLLLYLKTNLTGKDSSKVIEEINNWIVFD